MVKVGWNGNHTHFEVFRELKRESALFLSFFLRVEKVGSEISEDVI